MKLVVSRGTVVPFDSLPNRSIALDGYVQGPQIDTAGQRFSFDHHAGCVRHCTRATCEQVFDAILLGLDPSEFTVYVNDVDGDTALSVWLLENPREVRNPLVADLVRAVGLIDAHGPAYALGALDAVAQWFYEGAMAPERDARRNRTYSTLDLAGLLRACVDRCDPKDFAKTEREVVEFKVTHDGVGWIMASSRQFIFTALYERGVTRAVAYDALPDGSYVYMVGKKSEFVDGFPVGPHTQEGTILHALAAREPGWGGGSTIGGAPRNADGSRSRLAPAEVFSIISDVLRHYARPHRIEPSDPAHDAVL